MGKSNLLLGISLDIDTFKVHLKRVSKDGYKLHELDKDLLLQKTRELYDNILKLETSGENESVRFSKPEEKTTLPEKEVVETFKEILPEKEVVKPEPEKAEVEIQQPEPIAFEIKKPVVEVKVELKPEPTLSKESHIDLFSTEQVTVSDRFVDTEEKNLADKFQQSTFSDLRSGIGINEKFLFINELFGGDMGRYNKTLDELNSMQSKTGIATFLMELKIERQWNEEEEAFDKFKELVDRKFA